MLQLDSRKQHHSARLYDDRRRRAARAAADPLDGVERAEAADGAAEDDVPAVEVRLRAEEDEELGAVGVGPEHTQWAHCPPLPSTVQME